MSLAYRVLYAVGFTPWEQMADPQIAGQIARLFAREEEGAGAAIWPGAGSRLWERDLDGCAGETWLDCHRCGLRPEGPPQGT